MLLRRLAPGVAVLVSACTPAREPPWALLRPTVLAIRLNVVEEGPNSVDLIPIPADRVRSIVLPGDTVEARLLIADETGERSTEAFAPHWFSCPTRGRCFSLLRDHDAQVPCPTEAVDTICSLGVDPVLRHTIPGLPPDMVRTDSTGFARLSVVASVPGVRTTEECLEELSQDPFEDLGGCLLASLIYAYGPSGRFEEVLARHGIDGTPPQPSLEFEPFVEQPRFVGEVVRIDYQVASDGRVIRAVPGITTVVPPHEELRMVAVGDPRDGVSFIPQIPFEAPPTDFLESRRIRVYTPEPELFGGGGFVIRTGEPGDRFEALVVRTGGFGAQSWAAFDFVVEGQ